MTTAARCNLAMLLLAALFCSSRISAQAVEIPAVDDLPLIEVPVRGDRPHVVAAREPPLVVILTGDGGWAEIDREIAAVLSANDMPVVGFNSLRYFWKPRSPEEATRDVARTVRHYLHEWSLSRVVFIGYSFGADVLPFVVNRLPADLHGRVDGVVLIGPSRLATFEVHISAWLPWKTPAGAPLAPELANLDAHRVLCIHGSDEQDSSCADLAGAGARVQEISGGHHFDRQYPEVANRLLAFVQETMLRQ
ncbi:MAG: AcvB/VirJ family lysyl-phosphatidylglycerol hydrolase [Steroidobacteraceae bacterium]